MDINTFARLTLGFQFQVLYWSCAEYFVLNYIISIHFKTFLLWNYIQFFLFMPALKELVESITETNTSDDPSSSQGPSDATKRDNIRLVLFTFVLSVLAYNIDHMAWAIRSHYIIFLVAFFIIVPTIYWIANHNRPWQRIWGIIRIVGHKLYKAKRRTRLLLYRATLLKIGILDRLHQRYKPTNNFSYASCPLKAKRQIRLLKLSKDIRWLK